MSKDFTIAISGRSFLAAAIAVAVMACIGAATGVYLASSLSAGHAAKAEFDALKLHATSAAGGKQISLATGLIDNTTEGIYVLDHLTGNLQCWVISPRTSEIAAVFRTNVNRPLELDRAGEKDFVMATGVFEFTGGNAGQTTPASSIVYVGDGNSGNVAAFGLQFNRTMIQKGTFQEGALQFLGKGPARMGAQRRDQ